MTAKILNYFYTNDFDEKIVITGNNQDYTVKEIKPLIAKKINFLLKITQSKVILTANNNYDFFLNFFACIFAKKEIILQNDEKHLIKEDALVLTTQTSDDITEHFEKIDIKKAIVNIFTSGSSGESKCVQKSLENLIQEAEDLSNELNLENIETVISTAPFNHLFGLTFYFMLPLIQGFTINLERISYPENITGKHLLFVTTPSFLEKMHKYQDKPQVKLEKIITAGARLKNEEFNFALDIANSVTEIYGSTESGVIAHRETPCCNLKLFKNVEIINKDNQTYLKTNYSIENIQKSGDIIKLLQNREIELLGRSDRILKIQEKRISAQEIEKFLEEHRFVKEAYCFSNNDKICALISLKDAGFKYIFKNSIPALKKELKNYTRQQFEIVPQVFKFIDEIPKTERGKCDREKIFNIFQTNMSYPLICERKKLENEAELKVYFYKHCNFFKGHFENFPILAGVVQILFASMVIKDIFNLECSIGQIRKIKFKNIIEPDKIINLRVEQKKSNFEFTYYNNDNIYSSGVLPIKNIFEGEND